MHPRLLPSAPSPDTFEEVQFFSGRNYLRGLDWYLRFFEPPDASTNNDTAAAAAAVANNNNNMNNISPNVNINVSGGAAAGAAAAAVQRPLLFEKSATYFDNELVPRRAHSLLPRAKLVKNT
jgi:heparan sulfate N-deacetylase/N-sulfotransferase NDST2